MEEFALKAIASLGISAVVGFSIWETGDLTALWALGFNMFIW